MQSSLHLPAQSPPKPSGPGLFSVSHWLILYFPDSIHTLVCRCHWPLAQLPSDLNRICLIWVPTHVCPQAPSQGPVPAFCIKVLVPRSWFSVWGRDGATFDATASQAPASLSESLWLHGYRDREGLRSRSRLGGGRRELSC